jgi:hypothetical protein
MKSDTAPRFSFALLKEGKRLFGCIVALPPVEWCNKKG